MSLEILREAEEINQGYGTFVTLIGTLQKGTPIVVKDNICTQGIKTTAGSKILSTYIPTFDATVIKKLKEKGFFVLGKTTQDAFGFGSFSTNSAYGIPKNPVDKTRVCGGSSGGTASFISLSKNVNYGLGQSTGGSITCPSAFCGVVGLTPTYGLVSRYGLIDYANSFDRIGPITKTVKQAAELLTIISGIDEKDQTTYDKSEDYTKYLGKGIKGMKACYIKETFSEGVEREVRDSVLSAITELKKKGLQVEEISFADLKEMVPIYYIIAMAEASTNLAKFCGMRYGLESSPENKYYSDYFKELRMEFGEEEKRRILVGTFIRMEGYRDAYYTRALKLKNQVTNQFKKIFKMYDLIIMPSMPIVPPKFEDVKKMSPAQNYMTDFLTIPAALTGLPSISVPVRKKGLPVGIQIVADHFNEGKLITVGDAYER